VSVDNVEALVLGGHGDDMVPVRSCCRVAGVPVDKFVDEATLGAIEARTRKAGGEIVGLIGVSAFWSPAIAAIEMVEAIVYDKKKIIASCVLLEGEYGVNGLFVGVPVVLGAKGIERIIEVDLTAAEKAAFEKSVAAVKKTADEVIAAG
jgi:malate dehydrogenase